jgi:hypothetical protein
VRHCRCNNVAAGPDDLYGSRSLRMSSLARTDTDTLIDMMHVGAGGIVGEHVPAAGKIFGVVGCSAQPPSGGPGSGTSPAASVA